MSAKDIGNVSVEGVTSQDIPATSQCMKSVEGDEYFDLVSTELFKHLNARVTSPLEGVRISGLNSNKSALSWFMLVFITFSSWITNYLPILTSVWIISIVISDWDLLSSFGGLFDLVSIYWNCWCVFVVFGPFSFSDRVGY